ncbi:hypothetical protein [Mesorhizobium sp. WSM4884]|uniref:hypothetical protein n=1 Tax=Mesorhizobium sp. WSM4884 TaxID=3038542 RepID=UPI002416FBD4|nr:hypothetical protein [Mesorhizobium sp. WSM4884]MDG4882754.1 hypothetical protein [Mesorhizobium sp. WSM4884]
MVEIALNEIVAARLHAINLRRVRGTTRAAENRKPRALRANANLFSSPALSKERIEGESHADETRQSDEIRYADGIHLPGQNGHRARG